MKFIELATPHMSAQGYEKEFVNEAFDTNWVAPLGKNVTEFENDVKRYVGRREAVALSSGTAAIHLGLKYMGVKSGDAVFCSSFTFSGSCNPIMYLNAKPVFIDSDYQTYNMSPEALIKAYEKYPNPAAIIIVNLFGNAADYDKLLQIARSHNTPVLEDSAESLGTVYHGVQSGNFGDISVFSFNGNKIITTSGGGMLMCNDDKTSSKILKWATQSREAFAWYQHEEVGYNYRLSNVCAGIGRGQMRVLDERIARKREINAIYREAFSDFSLAQLAPETPNSFSNCWMNCLTLSKNSKVSFMQLSDHLKENEISSRPAWKPMHTQPVFVGFDYTSTYDDVNVAEDLFSRSLCLPSDTKLTDEDVYRVADTVKAYLKKKA